MFFFFFVLKTEDLHCFVRQAVGYKKLIPFVKRVDDGVVPIHINLI